LMRRNHTPICYFVNVGNRGELLDVVLRIAIQKIMIASNLELLKVCGVP
jgi:hypothetical protein